MSKSEHRYRIKFIQEFHLNKDEQKQFDFAKISLEKSYKEIYLDVKDGVIYWFWAIILANRFGESVRKASATFADLAHAAENLACAVKETRDVFN